MKLKVLNQLGEKVSDLTLNEQVFGIEPNMQVLYDVVNAQRAAMRQGTHATKTRAERRGGGRKPWRQKGTGRARHGSRRSPIWVGGGITFGPRSEKNYKVKVNKKVSKLAFKSVLSYRVANDQLIIVDKIELENPKTKDFQAILNNLNLTGRTLFVDVNLNENIELSSRNIPRVYIETCAHASVFDFANCEKVVLTTEAVKYYEEALLKWLNIMKL